MLHLGVCCAGTTQHGPLRLPKQHITLNKDHTMLISARRASLTPYECYKYLTTTMHNTRMPTMGIHNNMILVYQTHGIYNGTTR